MALVHRHHPIPMLLVSILALGGCGGSGSPTGGDDAAQTTDGGGGDSSTMGCGARVTIAFYMDADCTEAMRVGMRSYDTSLSCFSWTSMGSNAGQNSATRFQCYSDRLCYTQHPGSLTCGDGGHGWTDKQAKLGVCLKEPDGALYSKILSGTESCPAAPMGFECPQSQSMMGTDGVVACTSQ